MAVELIYDSLLMCWRVTGSGQVVQCQSLRDAKLRLHSLGFRLGRRLGVSRYRLERLS